MVYTKKEYSFVKFEKSNRKGKKYKAVLKNKRTGRLVSVHFGDTRYEQYRDTTGLKLYSDKDHYNTKRQQAYKARHAKDNLTDWTAGRFSWSRLWSLPL